MTELVKNVKGPSEWFCKNGKDCWYNGKYIVWIGGDTMCTFNELIYILYIYRIFHFS